MSIDKSFGNCEIKLSAKLLNVLKFLNKFFFRFVKRHFFNYFALFKDYAKKKLVFVEIDVKRNKKVDIKIDGKKDAKISKLKADMLKELRETLAKKFKVSGVPTAVVLSADGTVLQKHVGAGITAKEFVEKISSKKN